MNGRLPLNMPLHKHQVLPLLWDTMGFSGMIQMIQWKGRFLINVCPWPSLYIYDVSFAGHCLINSIELFYPYIFLLPGKDKRPVKSSVVGRPILLALEDIDGSPSFLEKALRFLEENGKFNILINIINR